MRNIGYCTWRRRHRGGGV